MFNVDSCWYVSEKLPFTDPFTPFKRSFILTSVDRSHIVNLQEMVKMTDKLESWQWKKQLIGSDKTRPLLMSMTTKLTLESRRNTAARWRSSMELHTSLQGETAQKTPWSNSFRVALNESNMGKLKVHRMTTLEVANGVQKTGDSRIVTQRRRSLRIDMTRIFTVNLRHFNQELWR